MNSYAVPFTLVACILLSACNNFEALSPQEQFDKAFYYARAGNEAKAFELAQLAAEKGTWKPRF